MDLRQLEQVVGVFDHGSVTAAAAALHLAQPSVSETLRRTERELGTPLFHRIGRRLVPTPAGERFVGPARRLLRDRDALVDEVRAGVGRVVGRLDIACLPTLATSALSGLLASLRRAHPDVTVRVLDGTDVDGTRALVLDGAAEVGIGELPAGDRLVEVPLGRQRLVAVLPPGTEYGAAVDGAADISVTMLATYPLLTGPAGSSTRRMLESALRAAATEPLIAAEVETREALVPLVVAGIGATVLPDDQADWARLQGAVVRPIRPAVSRRIGLFHRGGRATPPLAALLAIVADARGTR